MRKLTPPWIDDVKRYVPGKPIEEVRRELGIDEPAKLASNENCLGPSPAAVEAATRELSQVHLYPESQCYYLRRDLADRLKVPTESLIFGNGSHDLLDIAVRTFVFPDEEVLTADVTFVAYTLAAQTNGRKLVQIPVEDMTYDLESMADAINDKTKLILLANPNNPTGTIVRRAAFDAFLERVPKDVVLVVDEAYFEYVDDPEYPNSLQYHDGERRIITTRTFSKIYGLAGLRVGYAISSPELIEAMDKVRLVFNVSRVGQAAARAALGDHDHVERSRETAKAGLEYLYKQLEQRDIKHWKSHTNFVFIDFGRPAREVYDALLTKGVIVRPLPGPYCRVTVGLPDENRRFIEALDEVL